ncbi:MAG: TetR/AcrR family transcriptional regulator [Polyangiaceae bacterium]
MVRPPRTPNAPARAAAPPRPFLRGVDDARALLLTAARDLFLESGVAGFSLREVARRVGISPAAVYRHFEHKEALITAACTQGFQVFSSYLVRALAAPTPLARLLASGEQYRAFGLENPLDYRFIFMSPAEQMCPPSAFEGGPDLPQDATFRFLVDRVSECMAAGVLSPGPAEPVAVFIWAHVHGLISLRLSAHLDVLGDEPAFAEFYRDSVARLLRALSP